MSVKNNLFKKLLVWLEALPASETLILSIVAALVGLASGGGVWLFKRLIDWTETAARDVDALLNHPLSGFGDILLPAAGGLVVGLIVHYFVGIERHHGVAGIMEAAALAGGRLRYRRIPAKTIAAAVGIGSGASVGPEDPSVQIGANIGSFAGQRLLMSDERVRALVAAGGAAGIAAAFNAPIAAVFFALEILLGEIGGSALGVVVIASVTSAVFTQAVEGAQPAFQVPAYAFHSAWELPLYFGLGLLAGPVAALYIRLLYLAHDVFQNLNIRRWLKPVVAGLIVGIVGHYLPQVKGIGYETLGTILAGREMLLGFLLALLAAKILLTPISIGGGFMGGVFAPSLFLGGTLGAAFGLLAEQVFPALGVNPAAFAMVGMAAVLAGAVHAPLTAILLLFEMTNDYHIILPLMFSVTVSLAIAQRLEPDSVYTLGLSRKGIRLERGKVVEVLQAITVADVMEKDFPILRETDTINTAADLLAKTRRQGLPVLNQHGELSGILTLQDIDRAGQEKDRKGTVGEICTRDLIVCTPDEKIGAVLRRMSPQGIGRLPVVDPDDSRRLIGFLRRSDVIRAYDLALAKRASMHHKATQVRLGAYSGDGFEVLERVVEPGAACAGKPVKYIPFPANTLVASVRRGRRLITPHGDTILQPGDVLVIVSSGEADPGLDKLCQRPNQPS